jgi:hypothetical protein
MPYKSRAERESENWMTLPQVSAHIKSVDCLDDERTARRDLLKALINRAFYWRGQYLVRWKDKFSISGSRPSEIAPSDLPPRGQEWAHAKIRWVSGKVLDPYGAARNGKWEPTWRVVWLARWKVMELWPATQPSSASKNAGSSPIAPSSKRKTGPKTKKRNSIEAAMKTDLVAKHLTVEQLRPMAGKELGSKYGDKFGAGRTTCLEARKRVLTEFDGV